MKMSVFLCIYLYVMYLSLDRLVQVSTAYIGKVNKDANPIPGTRPTTTMT